MSTEEKAPEAPAENQPENKPVVVDLSAIKMDAEGLVQTNNLMEELRVCDSLVRAKMVPAAFDTPSKLFAARQLARELGLPVNSAVRQIMVVNDSPSIWGELPLSLVRASGQLESIKEFFIAEDYRAISLANKNLNAEIFAAVCIIKRADEDEREFFFTMEMAKRAGLPTKNGIWKSWLHTMMMRKVRSLALKSVFPDVLQAVSIAEYDHNLIPGQQTPPRDVGGSSVADEANNMFGNADEKEGTDVQGS